MSRWLEIKLYASFSFTMAADSEKLSFATGASDGRAKLWSLGGASLGTLEGHTDRLGRIAFHPMGRHLASASFDRTWRMWDLETQACLQEQEGHSRAVYTVVFQVCLVYGGQFLVHVLHYVCLTQVSTPCSVMAHWRPLEVWILLGGCGTLGLARTFYCLKGM